MPQSTHQLNRCTQTGTLANGTITQRPAASRFQFFPSNRFGFPRALGLPRLEAGPGRPQQRPALGVQQLLITVNAQHILSEASEPKKPWPCLCMSQLDGFSCGHSISLRSSSREVRIRVPNLFCSLFQSGNPPAKKGKRARLGDLVTFPEHQQETR